MSLLWCPDVRKFCVPLAPPRYTEASERNPLKGEEADVSEIPFVRLPVWTVKQTKALSLP